MVKILILGNMSDDQSGLYILNACREFSSNTAGIDIRRMYEEVPKGTFQETLINEIDELTFIPELIIVMKGLEIQNSTIEYIKQKFNRATLVNWFFDIYLFDKPIWKEESYFDTINLYDYFICAHRGVATELQNIGFDNAVFVEEGCSQYFNNEVYLNNFQRKKYTSEVIFIGSLGLSLHHKNRIPTLVKIIENGFDLKIYGDIVCKPHNIPKELRKCHTGQKIINETHSAACQCASVVIGLDVDNKIDKGYSARLFRVLCAGGLYLSEYVVGMEDSFIINKKDEKITDNQDFIVFYDDEDLISKLDFILSNKNICDKIRENGKNKVLKNHTFSHRIKEIIDLKKQGDIHNN
jgi:spore maturation protein CgeB